MHKRPYDNAPYQGGGEFPGVVVDIKRPRSDQIGGGGGGSGGGGGAGMYGKHQSAGYTRIAVAIILYLYYTEARNKWVLIIDFFPIRVGIDSATSKHDLIG